MKFEFIKTIANIKAMRMLQNELLYKTDNNLIFWGERQLFDMQFHSIQYKDTHLFFYNSLGEFCVQENNDLKNFGKTFFNVETIFNNTALVITDIEIDNLTYQVIGVLSLLDLNENVVLPLWKEKNVVEILVGFYENKFYFSNSGIDFFSIDVKDNFKIENIKLPFAINKMDRYLGFTKGHAFINNEGKQTVHIDLLEPEKSVILNLDKQTYLVNFLNFDENTSCSYQLYRKYLITVNYITNSFEVIEIKELLSLNISVICAELYEHFFVFTAHKDGYSFSSGLVGSFNIVTMKLEWIHDLHFEAGRFFGAGNPPVLVKNKLYVLDTKNDLYVFEKA